MLDIAAETRADAARRATTIARLQAMKTGALDRASASKRARSLAGAPAAARAFGAGGYGRRARGGVPDRRRPARRRGRRGDAGKRVGKDAGRNKATFVAALGLEGARVRRDALVAEAIAAVDATGLGAAGETLREAARFVASKAKLRRPYCSGGA